MLLEGRAMDELKIPAGTSLFIGAPARPMERRLSTAVGKLTASIDGIIEAHLPQMFAPGVMEEPAQVLVIVMRDEADLKAVIDRVGGGLAVLLPPGRNLDVWPIPIGHAMLDEIRRTGCQI
jgi:hypothetical protein